jgi:hypothetical protein
LYMPITKKISKTGTMSRIKIMIISVDIVFSFMKGVFDWFYDLIFFKISATTIITTATASNIMLQVLIIFSFQ